MTVWVGAIPLTINGEKTLVEFLHTVPGLDTHDPNRASVEQNYATQSGSRMLQFLSPVSLALAKLHALRHFPQEDRQDGLHLRLCLRASHAFIAQLIAQKAVRDALWNCERLVETHYLKPNIKLARQHQFSLLDAIPIEKIAEASGDSSFDESDRKRLANFCKILCRRWAERPLRDCCTGWHLEIGRASGYRALYSGLEDRRVSLNTYARKNGVPCWSCTSLDGSADRRLSCSANET